jgi:hypothetical protein
VAAAVGVIGLAFYLVLLLALAVPLFGRGEHRRLAYLVWAYIGLGVALPGLWERSSWVPMALAVLAAVGAGSGGAGRSDVGGGRDVSGPAASPETPQRR